MSEPDYSTRSSALRETCRRLGLTEEETDRTMESILKLTPTYEPEPRVPETYPHREGVKAIWTAVIVFAGLVMILGVLVAVMVSQTPKAEVTPDQGYISSVRAGTTKLAFIKDQELIDLGHKACTARRQGMTTEETLLNVASASADRTLRNDLAYTIGAAYTAYCPEYTR